MFNSDTLIYRYGEVQSDGYAVYSNNVVGTPGESGSSLLIPYDGGYASVGVLSFGMHMYTRIIDSTTFATFSDIMRGIIASTKNGAPPSQHASGNDGIMVFPNPVSDEMQVRIQGLNDASIDAVDVYDHIGRHILRSQSARVSCRGLVAGSYFAIVTVGSGRHHTTFVVQ